MPFDNEGICVEEVATCSFCQQPGQLLYAGLRDRIFRVRGEWNLFRCGQCGLVWLNPRPVRENIAELYADYFTHMPDALPRSPSRDRTDWRHKVKTSVLAMHFGYTSALPSPLWKLIGRVGGGLPHLHDWVGRTVMFLPALACGQLLDIGCGNGSFLAGMRERGWEVQGLEPDSEAADLARKRHGLKVITGTLEETSLSVSSVDAITLNHVIEHVPDPVGLLSECRRILKPGGKLVVATPNVESLAHRMSGVRWQHLDPPRHLCLFSSRALTACVEKAGLQPESLHTRVPFRSWASLFLENAASLVDRKAGEELVLVARGPGSLGAG